jgi:hypothetical protein
MPMGWNSLSVKFALMAFLKSLHPFAPCAADLLRQGLNKTITVKIV